MFSIEKNTLRLDASRRGGGIEIDCSELFGDNAMMTAYQNYLGGGMLGSVQSARNFKGNDELADELADKLKKYFFNITNDEASEYDEWNDQNYQNNQNMPVSAY